MAVHAELGRRHVCDGGEFDRVVAVTAVHAEIAGVQLVAEADRLARAIPDIGIPWRAEIPEEADDRKYEKYKSEYKIGRYFVCPFREYLCQYVNPRIRYVAA